jgi:SAM-dependent methyltransferase
MLEGVPGEVLDYGCGRGDLTFAISRTHPVQGVDVDLDRVAFATQEYAPLQFSRCEPDHLAFPDQSFDIVVSAAVIHFVPDPTQHIREAYRVLRDSGRLLMVCSNILYVRNAFRRVLGRRGATTSLWIPSEKEVSDLLTREGFEIEARSYFYDPPFEGWKNLGDVFAGLIQQVLSLLRVRKTCNYFLLRARKKPRFCCNDSSGR